MTKTNVGRRQAWVNEAFARLGWTEDRAAMLQNRFQAENQKNKAAGDAFLRGLDSTTPALTKRHLMSIFSVGNTRAIGVLHPPPEPKPVKAGSKGGQAAQRHFQNKTKKNHNDNINRLEYICILLQPDAR